MIPQKMLYYVMQQERAKIRYFTREINSDDLLVFMGFDPLIVTPAVMTITATEAARAYYAHAAPIPVHNNFYQRHGTTILQEPLPLQ